MEPYLNKGHCLVSDNFFTSFKLAKELLQNKTTFLGTVLSNRKDIPCVAKQKQSLFQSLAYENLETGCVLTVYQCKTDKNVLILSTKVDNANVPSTYERRTYGDRTRREENIKKKPSSVLMYNKTKFGVDCVDHMTRAYNVKAPSRRWPVQVWYNILNLAAINAYILYKKINSASVSRREFIRILVEEIYNVIKPAEATPTLLSPTTPPARKRVLFDVSPNVTPTKSCQINLCNRNNAKTSCSKCNKSSCGKCIQSVEYKCICKKCAQFEN
jgi:hypothetical protein